MKENSKAARFAEGAKDAAHGGSQEQPLEIDPEIREAMQEQSREAAGRGPNAAKEERKR